MFQRILSRKLLEMARQFPVVAVTGPRQSGKTTLVQALFPKKPYVSLEDIDTRESALSDPRGFLRKYPDGAVLDEVQRTPLLFSYLQTIVDQKKKSGLFILTGSQQFLLLENLSQTLAGRVRILHLLPLSLEEIGDSFLERQTLEDLLFKGMYPRVHAQKIAPEDWYPDYIQTYIERDVRLIKNVGDLNTFQKFLRMCAGRTGQLLNLSSLANDCGITHNTAKSWLGILQASFIAFLIQPHHRNFNKRLVKTPKMYFYDPGLVSSLMGIENKEQLRTHPLQGNLVETFVMAELVKQRLNRGLQPRFYFWRDKTGNEIDCVVEKGDRLIPIEIKSGETVTEDFFKNLNYWNRLAAFRGGEAFLIYGGDGEQERRGVQVLSWRRLKRLRL